MNPTASTFRREFRPPPPLHWWNMNDELTVLNKHPDLGHSPNDYTLDETGTVVVQSGLGPGGQDVANQTFGSSYPNKDNISWDGVWQPNSLSWCIWFIIDAYDTNGSSLIYWGDGTTNTTRLGEIWVGADGSINQTIQDYQGDSATISSPAGTYAGPGNWAHVAGVTYPNGGYRHQILYHNGVKAAGTTGNGLYGVGAFPSANMNLRFGRANTTATDFDGRIGMIGIWDQVITPGDAGYLYNNGTGRLYNGQNWD